MSVLNSSRFDNPRLNDNQDHPGLKTLADCLSQYGIAVESQTQEFNLATDYKEVSKPV